MQKLYLAPVLIFLSFVTMVYLVLPKYSHVQNLETKVKQKAQEVERIKEHLAEVGKITEELANQTDALEIINLALPEKPLIPALFYLTAERAKASGLILESISVDQSSQFSRPKRPDEAEEKSLPERVGEIYFNIALVGSHSSLEDFVAQIENSARFIEVVSISFEEPSEDLPEFDLTLKAYRY